MGFFEREKSEYGGSPLELYRFSMGERQWMYTSADQDVIVNGDTYEPCFIARGDITRTGDSRKSAVDIEIAASNPLALMFRNGWVVDNMILTITRRHLEDSESVVIWKGRVISCKWSGSKATLVSDSVFTLLTRAGLRRVFQVGCPHILYKSGRGECNANPDAFLVSGTVTGIEDNVIKVSGAGAYAAGYFTGGICKGGGGPMLILDHAGESLTLLAVPDGLQTAQPVQLLPGCDRTLAACANKFGNAINYGGLPYMPTKNPFSGDALV